MSGRPLRLPGRVAPRRLLARTLRSWPQKLGALLLALMLWLFVSSNETTTIQRSLFVPITAEGIGEDEVTVGVPENVEITVQGASSRVDRLRPENFEAILDLEGISGEFREPVRVLSPQAIELLRSNPTEVIGFVESVQQRELPVAPALLGTTPTDLRLEASVEPGQVTVRGRSRPLESVARVIAPVPTEEGSSVAPLVAVDAEGRPVEEVEVAPAQATVTVRASPALARRSVRVALVPPPAPGFTVTARLDQSAVEVVGPPSVLAGLEEVRGTVDQATGELTAGSYTLPVTIALPEGVFALDIPTATVRLTGEGTGR